MKTKTQQEPENTASAPTSIGTPITAIPERVMGPLRENLHQQPPQPNSQVLPPNSETPSPLPSLDPTAPSQNESPTMIQTTLSSNEPTSQTQNESQPTTQPTTHIKYIY